MRVQIPARATTRRILVLPKGSGDDAEQAEAFHAVVRALNEAPDDLAEPLVRELAELVIAGTLRRDHFLLYRVMSFLLDAELVGEQRGLLGNTAGDVVPMGIGRTGGEDLIALEVDALGPNVQVQVSTFDPPVVPISLLLYALP